MLSYQELLDLARRLRDELERFVDWHESMKQNYQPGVSRKLIARFDREFSQTSMERDVVKYD